MSRTQQFLGSNALHIGIARLLAGNHADTHAKIDVRATVVHLAVHQSNQVIESVFKIEVGIVATHLQGSSQHAAQQFLCHTEMIHGL